MKTEGLPEFSDKVKSTYDYVTGKRTNNLTGLVDATDEEIKTIPDLEKFVDTFKSAKGDIDVQVDGSKKSFLVKFSAKSVPKDLADQIKPDGKYYNMINHYDKNSKEVEMIFTVPKKESVMAPTPTPYKPELKTESGVGYDLIDRKSVEDRGFMTDYSWYKSTDGMNVFVLGDRDFYGPADGEFDFETESDEEAQSWFDNYNGFEDESEDSIFEALLETDGLDTSVLVRKVNSEGQDSIEMDINGRIYSFTMKEDSPYTIDQMFHKVDKMRHYSEGRALAFMKKNMIGRRVESALRESLVTESAYFGQGLGDTWSRDNSDYYDARDKEMRGHSDVGKRVRVINKNSEFYMKSFIVSRVEGDTYFVDLGGTTISFKRDDLKFLKSESSNPFKYKHICDGCGKPLSQCTCEVQDEDEVVESLTEEKDSVSKDDRDDIIFRLRKLRTEASEALYKYESLENIEECRDTLYYLVNDSRRLLDLVNDLLVSRKSESLEDSGLEEEISGGCTQPSSVGQYKRGKLDMFPEDKEED